MLYVIVRDGGYEGKSPPLVASTSLHEAHKALAFMQAMAADVYALYAVPEWPEPPNCWYNTKPIDPTEPRSTTEP